MRSEFFEKGAIRSAEVEARSSKVRNIERGTWNRGVTPVSLGYSAGELSAVCWGVTTRILYAWMFTLPDAALLASLIYYLIWIRFI